MNKISTPIKRTLEKLGKNDQKDLAHWQAGKISREKLIGLAKQRLEVLKKVTEKYDFPNKKNSTKNAYKAGVLITLHGGNATFMKKYLSKLKSQDYKNIDPSDIALVTDRIAVLNKKPQRYGTQFKILADKSVEFYPIKNPKKVDERRKKLGLSKLDSYRRKFL